MGDVDSLISVYVIICKQLSRIRGKKSDNYYLENTKDILDELFI